MAYVPNNTLIFTAAFAGALAGMGASDRVPTDSNPADYAGLATVAGAFAQAFDTEWAASPSNVLNIQATQELCEVAWQDRSPGANPDENGNPSPFLNPATYTGLVKALIAIIRSGENYYAAQGIVPPSGSGTPGAPADSLQFADPTATSFVGDPEWTRVPGQTGRLNCSYAALETNGPAAGLIAPQVFPLRPTFPGFGLNRYGVPVGGTLTPISAWFPSLDAGGAFDIGFPVVQLVDIAPNIAQMKFGSRSTDVGKFVNILVEGQLINLVSYDGGGTFTLAGANQVGVDRQGALFSYRAATGTNGSGNDASFGGPVAGPMHKLHKIQTLPVGNPTAALNPAIWDYFIDGAVGQRITHFPSGNKAITPDFDGPMSATLVALPAFAAGDCAPAAIVQNALYDIPVTAVNSTVTLPAATTSGTIAYFTGDGVKNGHTITFRDATGAVVISAAATASKRFVATAIKIGAIWRVDLGASSP